MTLKHIKFYDSPVMRQLSRDAIKNGMVTPSVETMIKTASSADENKILETDDLFTSTIKLISKLRDGGYTKEASQLESKLFQYKKAEKEIEISPIMEQAHPEGDVRMAPASDELGDIETKPSQHKKIMKIIEKEPTGKEAELVSFLLKSAKEILKIGENETPVSKVNTYVSDLIKSKLLPELKEVYDAIDKYKGVSFQGVNIELLNSYITIIINKLNTIKYLEDNATSSKSVLDQLEGIRNNIAFLISDDNMAKNFRMLTTNFGVVDILKTLNYCAQVLNNISSGVKTIPFSKDNQGAIDKQAQLEEEAFDRDFGKDRSEEKKKLITEINNKTSSYLKGTIIPVLQKVYNSIPEKISFDENKVLSEDSNYVALYSRESGVPVKVIKDYGKANFVIYGNEAPNAQHIFDVLSSLEGEALKSYCDWASPNIFPRYFLKKEEEGKGQEKVKSKLDEVSEGVKDLLSPAKQVAEVALGIPIYNYVKNDAVLKEAAQDMHNAMTLRREFVFGNNLEKANKNYSNKISKIKNGILNIINSLESFVYLDVHATSNREITDQIWSLKNKIDYYILDKNISEEIQILDSNFTLIDIISLLNTCSEALEDFTMDLKPISVNDKVPSQGEVEEVANSFKETGLTLYDYLNSQNKASPQYKKALSNYKKIQEVYNNLNKALSERKLFTYNELMKYVIDVLPKATTFERLKQYAKLWASSVKGLVQGKAASSNNELVKIAQDLPDIDSESDVKPAATTSPVSTPAKRVPSGGNLTPADLTKSDQAAVARMQLSLNELGQAISATPEKFPGGKAEDGNKIIAATGAKSNPTIHQLDGKWGPMSQASLNLASKYLEKLPNPVTLQGTGSTQGRWDGKNHIHVGGTTEIAEANVVAISSALNSLGIKSSIVGTENAIYDSYNGKNVLASDLASLYSYYEMLLKNGWAQEEVRVNEATGDTTKGINAQTYVNTLRGLQERAKEKYTNRVKYGDQYYSATIKLYNEWASIASSYKFGPNDLVPGEVLKTTTMSSSLSKLPTSTPAGQGVGQEGKPMGKKPSMEGLDYEGIAETGDVRIPPIRNYLNFKTPWFSTFHSKFRDLPGLTYDTFRTWTGDNFVNRFTSAKSEAKDPLFTALGNMGASNIRENEVGKLVMEYGGRTRELNEISNSDPNFKAELDRNMRAIQFTNPKVKASQFLNYLRNTLNDVYNAWSERNKDEKLQSKVERDLVRWQEEIGNKLEDIRGF